MTCSICNKRDATFLKVTRVAPDGTESPLTTTCSVLCLLRWGHQYATLQSAKLAWNVKTALASLFDKLKG